MKKFINVLILMLSMVFNTSAVTLSGMDQPPILWSQFPAQADILPQYNNQFYLGLSNLTYVGGYFGTGGVWIGNLHITTNSINLWNTILTLTNLNYAPQAGTSAYATVAGDVTGTTTGKVAEWYTYPAKGHITANASNQYDIGSADKPFSNGYFGKLNLGGVEKSAWPTSGGSLVTETKTNDYSVQVADSAKLLVMNVAGGTNTFNLPSVGSSDVGVQYYFAKINTGKFVIDASDSDKIADSGEGDTIYNDSTNEVYSTLHLVLVSETQWSIMGAHGTWTSTD